MICKEYSELTIPEQYQMIGKICHLAQNHSEFYLKIQQMIKHGERKGLFANVKINPPTRQQDLDAIDKILN